MCIKLHSKFSVHAINVLITFLFFLSKWYVIVMDLNDIDIACHDVIRNNNRKVSDKGS